MESRGSFLATYIAQVRISVFADGATIVREGHGSDEGHGSFPGEVHDTALKAAETDATKRALATFGRPFGLELYRKEKKTVESSCVLTRENRGSFLAIYIARVRITVHADGAMIIREGHGSGEGRGVSPGEVHDTALKAAETDATKRALATFGKRLGLEL